MQDEMLLAGNRLGIIYSLSRNMRFFCSQSQPQCEHRHTIQIDRMLASLSSSESHSLLLISF